MGGRPIFPRETTIYNHKLVFNYWKRHNIPKQYHGNYNEEEKIQLDAWNWHFEKWLPEIFMCPGGWFLRIWCPKGHPDALLVGALCTPCPFNPSLLNCAVDHTVQVPTYEQKAGLMFIPYAWMRKDQTHGTLTPLLIISLAAQGTQADK